MSDLKPNHRQRIEFLLYDNALGLDIVGPLDVFSIATECLAASGFPSRGYLSIFSGKKEGAIQLSSGLNLLLAPFSPDGDAPDILVVPGGKQPERQVWDKEVLEYIQHRAREAKAVVSICNGAFILAACGLLDNKKATTHWLEAERMTRMFPKVKVCPDQIWVQDGKVWTSAGVTAGIDLALAMVEADHGPALAMRVSRMLVLYLRRSGGQSQFSEPMRLREMAGSGFVKLHDWMANHLDKQLKVERLAKYMGMSPRNFSRSFTKTTGIPPAKYVELLRLNRAKEILETSDASIKEVAQVAGFMREERLRQAFTRHLGIGPSQYRNRFSLFN